MGPREIDGLFALLREVRDQQIETVTEVRHLVDAEKGSVEKVRQLELQAARTQGAVSILKWAVPGGPVAIALIAAVAIYVKGG